jgi:capsular polysaccharide biosynthesis protein
MSDKERDIELMDFLFILWKRKWLIALLTIICAITAGLLAFLLPRQWEISSVVVPSKILTQTLSEVVLLDPKQLVAQINEGSYSALIEAELKLDPRTFPKLRAENLKATNLIKITVKEKDVAKAKRILTLLLDLIKKEADQKAGIEIKNVDSTIKSREIEKTRIEGEIKIQQKKLTIVTQRKKEIENEMSLTRKRLDALESDQRASLKEENKNKAENLGMLLYSNEIQQSLRYYDTLNELLNSKKIEEEDLALGIQTNGQLIKQKENDIANLIEAKGRIDYTQIMKEPTSSLGPVFPQKKLFVAAGLLLGFFASILVAFFLEYLESAKNKNLSGRAV